MAKYTLEELIIEVRTSGPKVIKELRTRLDISDANQLCSTLRREGMNLEPFDLPGTFHVWMSVNEKGVPYQHVATKQLISKLSEEKGVDFKTFEGFRGIIPLFTADTFMRFPINEWETTLGGMFAGVYDYSPSAAVLDLVEHDDEFEEIRKRNLRPYDFMKSPLNNWVDEEGNPTNIAREATKQLIKKLAKEKGVDFKTFEGFREILPILRCASFNNTPINEWETTLGGMLAVAYNCSPSTAVLDLVKHDDEFEEIRKRNLRPYDFPMAPLRTWIAEDPNKIAREITKQLIRKLASELRVDYKSLDGLKTVITNIREPDFYREKVNEWGTTCGSLLVQVYKNSRKKAVLDLVEHDKEFLGIKRDIIRLYKSHKPHAQWG